MKKNLHRLLIILFLFVLTIGITYGRYTSTTNVTGTIKAYDFNCVESGVTNLANCILLTDQPTSIKTNSNGSIKSSSYTAAKTAIESKERNILLDPSILEDVGTGKITLTAPSNEYGIKIKENQDTSSMSLSTTAHYTISNEYYFNVNTGIYYLQNYANDIVYENLDYENNEYYTCGPTTATEHNCSTLYRIKQVSITNSDGKITYNITKADVYSYNEKYSFNSELGLYASSDENSTMSYYFRGNVQNNYVKFAGFYWRIMRINGDGTIRLIYAGTQAETGEVDNYDSIGSYKYNTNNYNPEYVNYVYNEPLYEKVALYPTSGTVKFTNYSEGGSYYFASGYTYNSSTRTFTLSSDKTQKTINESHKDIIANTPYTCISSCTKLLKVISLTDSSNPGNGLQVQYVTYGSESDLTYSTTATNTTIKAKIDEWYENNLSSYESYLADSVFCNDTVATSGGGIVVYKTSYYGGYKRVMETQTPSFICPNKENKYTVNDTTNGNGLLTYPIALPTVDEMMFAGSIYKSINNNTYLNSGIGFWSMSAANYNVAQARAAMWRLTASGSLSTNQIAVTSQGVRPVINLKSTTTILSGTGTANDPYVITK